MKNYLVSYQDSTGRWINIGIFRARSAAGALQQAARDIRHFPNASALCATLKS